MGLNRKTPKADLKKYYTIFLQLGLIATMSVMLGLFKAEFRTHQEDVELTNKQETIKMEEVVQTKQTTKPPPPPRPPVPVEVPNDEIIEDEIIDLDAELDMNKEVAVPPPPPKAEEKEDEDEVFVVVEHMPELRGGLAGIQKDIKYPEIARKAGIEGRVYVQFVVNERGRVENARVVRGIGGGCDEEALRVVKKAKFRPGMQRGRPVQVQMSLPIVFKLQN